MPFVAPVSWDVQTCRAHVLSSWLPIQPTSPSMRRSLRRWVSIAFARPPLKRRSRRSHGRPALASSSTVPRCRSGGLEAAKRVRDIPGLERTPIIFVSAAPADEIDDTEVRSIGLVDYLPFPLDQRLLQRKVALLLELHRQQIEIEELRGDGFSRIPGRKKSAPSEQAQSMPPCRIPKIATAPSSNIPRS